MMPKAARRWQTGAATGVFAWLLASPVWAIELDVTPSPDVAVVLFTPPGRSPGVRGTDLVQVVSGALRRRTRLRVQGAEEWSIDPIEIGECPPERRFICWARIALARAPMLAYLQVASTFLVAEGELRLVTYWLDLQGVRKVLEQGLTEVELERAIFSQVMVSEPARVIASPEGLADHFEKWSEQLLPTLPPIVVSGGYGNISLELTEASRLTVDQRVLGDLEVGTHQLVGVEPGSHRIGLQSGRDPGPGRQVTLEVPAGSTVRLSVSPTLALRDPTPDWFVMTTVGVALAGGVLIGAGLRDYQGNPCDSADPSCDPSPGRATECELDPSACPATSGVAFLAVGSGLLSLAITAGIGAIAFEERGLPWWSVLAGLIVGGVGAGLTAAAL